MGKSTFSMPITRWFEDAFGLVWAGVFALLADAPLGVAIWTGLPPGKLVTTSELNLSFVRPFTRNTGNIVGRATSIHQGRQVGLAAVEISDREAGPWAMGPPDVSSSTRPSTLTSSTPSLTLGRTIRRNEGGANRRILRSGVHKQRQTYRPAETLHLG